MAATVRVGHSLAAVTVNVPSLSSLFFTAAADLNQRAARTGTGRNVISPWQHIAPNVTQPDSKKIEKKEKPNPWP